MKSSRWSERSRPTASRRTCRDGRATGRRRVLLRPTSGRPPHSTSRRRVRPVTRTRYSGSIAGGEHGAGTHACGRPAQVDWYIAGRMARARQHRDPPVGDPGLVAAHSGLRRQEAVMGDMQSGSHDAATGLPVLLNMGTRSTLFNLAIARGGRSAYTRLRNAKGTPLEVLSTVAGVSPEVLVDDWRTRALAAVPHSARPSLADTTVLVAWTLFFGFAATRRRPWS